MINRINERFFYNSIIQWSEHTNMCSLKTGTLSKRGPRFVTLFHTSDTTALSRTVEELPSHFSTINSQNSVTIMKFDTWRERSRLRHPLPKRIVNIWFPWPPRKLLCDQMNAVSRQLIGNLEKRNRLITIKNFRISTWSISREIVNS